MKLIPDEFDRIAALSMLKFSEEEKTSLMDDLNKLLNEAEKLKDFGVSDENPLINPSADIETGILRKDLPQKPVPKKVIMDNAPRKQGSYILVSKRSYVG